jgi:hypothetical protein
MIIISFYPRVKTGDLTPGRIPANTSGTYFSSFHLAIVTFSLQPVTARGHTGQCSEMMLLGE